MRRWSVLFMLLLIAPSVWAQVSNDTLFEAAIHRGIENVYNLEFEEAEAEFAALVALQPHHPAGPFFRAMVKWWRIMVDLENRQYDEEYYATLESVVAMCDSMLELNEHDVNALFFKGGALGFEGRLRFHRDDWLAAANAGRKALPLVRQASSADPKNYDIFLGTGIYNYYAEVIPDEYPVVKPLLLFIPSGDKNKGIRELTIASERGRYASIEATYFLMQIYYMFERDYVQALRLAERLHARFPANMVFHRYVGRCHVVMGNYQRAEETFREILEKVRNGTRGYTATFEREAAYYLGFCAMQMQRPEEALRFLYRCDELCRTPDAREASGFMAMANLKIGMVYDLQGRREDAVSQYRKVLSMESFKDTHTQAERYLQTPYAH
jgi:tetratricopeptide (TPR) repeat protein